MRLVMTHARRLQPARMHSAAAALDGGRFVLGVSCALSRIAATVAGSSIATTASPSADTPRCNSAPSDALGETSSRIPSANTLGFAVAGLDV